jgi:hypothetical protein
MALYLLPQVAHVFTPVFSVRGPLEFWVKIVVAIFPPLTCTCNLRSKVTGRAACLVFQEKHHEGKWPSGQNVFPTVCKLVLICILSV